MARVLIVDDEPGFRKELADLLQSMGLETVGVGRLQDALTQVFFHQVDVVLTDVWLPDGNSIRILPRFFERKNHPEVIILSKLGDPEGAELALNSGAWDYLDKNADRETIRHAILRALQYRLERMEKGEEDDTGWADSLGILGQSRTLKDSLILANKAAKTEVVVCISGETGTGKGLLARAIHERSNRAKKSFVVVDCASLPKNLVESELFGFVKGAFTGATMSKTGLVALAHGGTLFLDEVGELPLEVQSKFLRVLQERRFRPVGGEQEKTIDFRLIVATNRNLKSMVKEDLFRQDLLYRINAWRIELPPLRERGKDVELLAKHFTEMFCERSKLAKKEISPEFLEVVKKYDWPGNIRELANTLESVITFAGESPTLYRKHLPRDLIVQHIRNQAPGTEEIETAENDFTPPTWKEFREEVLHRAEHEYFKSLLAFVHHHPSEAIRVSGLSKSQFYKILKKIENIL